MAEAATTPASGATPEAPAAAPSAPDSTLSVTEWAKAEAAKLDQPQPTEASPAPATPDTSTETPTADKPTEGAGPADENKPGSRRERGEELRAQIEKEVREKFEADNQAAEAKRQAEQSQRDWDALLDRAQNGDTAAAAQLANVLTSSRTTQTAQSIGRNAVLTEIGADIVRTISALEGADDATKDALMKAPSVSEFGKQAFEHGQRIAKASIKERMDALEAENTSLKGKLAATGPSPLPTNGTQGRGNALPAGSSMRQIAAQVASEMGLSI